MPRLTLNPLLARHFYTFNDVLASIQFISPQLNTADILHYGHAQGVGFFVRVPNNLAATCLFNDGRPVGIPYPPNFVELYINHCVDIACEITIEPDSFPRGFSYYDNTSEIVPFITHPTYTSFSLWKTFDDFGIKGIPVTVSRLLISSYWYTRIIGYFNYAINGLDEDADISSQIVRVVNKSSENFSADNIDDSLGKDLKIDSKLELSDSESIVEGGDYGETEYLPQTGIETNVGSPQIEPTILNTDVCNITDAVRSEASYKVRSSNKQQNKLLKEDRGDLHTSLKMSGMYSMKVVMQLTGLGRSTINEKVNPKHDRFDPSFPKKYKISAGRIGFKADEIHNWLTSRNEI